MNEEDLKEIVSHYANEMMKLFDKYKKLGVSESVILEVTIQHAFFGLLFFGYSEDMFNQLIAHCYSESKIRLEKYKESKGG